MRRNPFLGKWKLVEVDEWAEADLDEYEPAMFEIRTGGEGSFNFLVVHAEIDWEEDEPEDYSLISFCWAGDDDGHEEFGRGWAVADDNEMTGEIVIFKGDRYRFRAVKKAAAKRAKR